MEVIHLKYPHKLVATDVPYSVAVGFFDGVHSGHQKVIEAAMDNAVRLQCKSAVMTLDPHPSIVLGGRNEKVFYITPLEQKIENSDKEYDIIRYQTKIQKWEKDKEFYFNQIKENNKKAKE